MSKKIEKGHKRDTAGVRLIKPYSTPVIKRSQPGKPDKWFISYTYAVPGPLQKYKDLHPRKIERFKVYQGINRVTGEAREQLAQEIRDALELALKTGLLNPFQQELDALEKVTTVKKERAKAAELTEEQKRLLLTSKAALKLFIDSRSERKLDPKTISMYQYTVDWMLPVIGDMLVKDVKYTHVAQALNKFAKAKDLVANTINNQFAFANTAFIWLTDNDYLIKNPLAGKIKPLRAEKSIHKWYDRETAVKVKAALQGIPWLKHVCQFTYWIMIRSKKELQHIKVGDIDFDLQQIRFRKEWTKNDTDQNRDYGPEFAAVLAEMNLQNLPKSWYIFGENGLPGPEQCGHNFYGRKWAEVRKDLGLSSDYTLYGWKHTRIVHMMMLKIDSYTISHAARHGDSKTTEEYKRDYDISLAKIYDKADLTF